MEKKIAVPPLSRIPGTRVIQEKHSKDLKTLTYSELLEMRDRQSKFLAAKKSLDHLPDKGQRLKESFEKLLHEIQRRDEVEAAAEMFSQLNIAATGKNILNNMEWSGRVNAASNEDDSHVADVLDSDDEHEMDPLRVIAQRTMHERQINKLPPPATLITAEDLADIESFKSSSDSGVASNTSHETTLDAEVIAIDAKKVAATTLKLQKNEESKETVDDAPLDVPELDQHALYLIEKTEIHAHPVQREKFKPFRTTITNVHDPAKERVRKKGKHWEVTAATPPLIQHKEAQLVPLAESAALQADYMKKVKELRTQQAELRLAEQQEKSLRIHLPEESILKTKSSFTTYRDTNLDHHLIEGKQSGKEQLNEAYDATESEAYE